MAPPASGSGSGSGAGFPTASASTSASATSASAPKLPPTGPRALREPGKPPSGPSLGLGYSNRFGPGPSHLQSHPHPPQPNSHHASSSTFPGGPGPGPGPGRARPIPIGPSATRVRSLNGYSSPDSSRSSRSPTAGFFPPSGPSGSNSRTPGIALPPSLPPPPPPPPADPSPPPPPSSRPPSPRRKSTSPSKRASTSTSASQDAPEYQRRFLPTTDTPRDRISIALPNLALPNGKARALPPHLVQAPAQAAAARPNQNQPNGSASQVPDRDFRTSSPPSGRPAPPPSDARPPSPPPPPQKDDAPPPPPPPPLSPPPAGPPSEPPSAPLSPRSVLGTRPASPADNLPPPSAPPSRPRTPVGSSAPGPPAFHFRELIRRDSVSDDDSASASASVPGPGPSSLSRAATPPPPPNDRPPTPPPPTWEFPPYVPPPAAFRRPGAGNYYVHLEPVEKGSKKMREAWRRIDGEGKNGIVRPKDPRLAMNAEYRQRGRGSAKNRSGFEELRYEWEEGTSTGPKPPPPPTAVLITGLNPLTTVDAIRSHLRTYGRVREIDAKMDKRSGMQLGICWVKFDGPASGRSGTAHDVAMQVCRACDGGRINPQAEEKMRVVLDGRGLRVAKAVEEEMAKRYAPKPKPKPPPPPPMAPTPLPQKSSVSTPSSAGGATPRDLSSNLPSRPPPSSLGTKPPVVPTPPPPPPLRARPPVIFNTRNLPSSLPARPIPNGPSATRSFAPSLPHRPATQQLSSSFTAAPFARDDRRGDRGDRYVPGDRPRSRSRSRSGSRTPRPRGRWNGYSSESESEDEAYRRPGHPARFSSDSEDDRHYRPRARSPVRRRKLPGGRDVGQDRKEAEERTKAALAENGHPAVFIDEKFLPVNPTNEEYLRDHFKQFKPSRILRAPNGWYVLFLDDSTAARVKMLLDGTAVRGHSITMSIKEPAAGRKPLAEEPPAPGANESKVEKGWRFLTVTKKNRTAPAPAPTAAAKLRAPAKVAPRRKRSASVSSEEAAPRTRRSPSLSSASELSDVEAEALSKSKVKRIKESPESEEEAEFKAEQASTQLPVAAPAPVPVAMAEEGEKGIELDVVIADVPVPKGKKRPAKPKAAKGAKKARIEEVLEDKIEVEPVLVVPLEPVAEIKLLDEIKPGDHEVGAKVKAKPAKPKKPAQTPLEKLVADGTIADEEDAYWLSQALRASEGAEPELDEDVEVVLDEEHPLYHTSGSWRAEGWKKIPQIQKSRYLPQRNRAAVAVEDAGALTTGRSARVTGRRLALDMETHRKTAAATSESDLFAFNQLRIRKKQLRFARSAIEGYGLYAMETIQTGEMVCEYVGELIRSSVADLREHRYLRQGIGSSYLFRIDGDVVCDATFRGSVSRLINHSCDPSASAKIISINGQSKIVIYAKRTLHPGEEILYDYKFPLESDPALRVPCLCGAKTCRGWLN